MSITSQAVSRRSVSNQSIPAQRVATRTSQVQPAVVQEPSGRDISAHYSNATDLPNFAGYTQPRGTATSRKQNPIAEFIPDDVYDLLRDYDLINEKALRDFLIRRDYRKVRAELHMSRADAIDFLQTHYPYLQVDTIRKIVYHVSSNPEKKRLL